MADGVVRPLQGSRVVIGACDLAAAGPRALLALQGTGPGCTAGLQGFDIGAMGASRPIIRVENSEPGGLEGCPIILRELNGARDGDHAQVPQVSLIIVNAVFKPGHQTTSALALVRYIAVHRTLFTRDAPLLIVSALRLPSLDRQGDLNDSSGGPPCLVKALNGAAVPPSLRGADVLPDDCVVRDGFFAALIHNLQALAVPACLLIVPGFKLQKRGGDDGLEAAARLGKAVAEATGLELDESLLGSLKPDLLAFLSDHQDATGGDIMYL